MRRIRFTPLRVGIAVLIIAALGIAAYFFFLPHTYVMHRTARGFEPKSLLIHKGDSVTFVSDIDEQYWPASGSHPTHLLYPEFDPKRPLQPKESWTFTFDRAGVWSFHDHMNPVMTGSILVEGAPGESVKNCLDASASGIKASCYAAQIASAISNKGVDAAFGEFEKYYEQDQTFRENCHDVMHVFGSRAYDLFEKTKTPVIRPETSFCAYGFYHGFIEEMFAVNGPEQLDQGKAYCDMIANSSAFPSKDATKTASGACYHGMGHATFDTIPGTQWGNDEKMVSYALGKCKTIASNEEQLKQCGSGVFNSLANAYSGLAYELKFNDVEPLKICAVQEVSQQIGCYKEIVMGQIRHKNLDLAGSLKFIYAINNVSIAQEALFGYIDDYLRYNRGNLTVTNLPAFCNAQPAIYQQACIKGVVTGLVGGGEPGREYEKPLQFCALVTDGTLHAYCVNFSFDILSTLYSKDRITELCASEPEADQVSCKR